MPQVDLETLVSSVCAGGSDRKIACETVVAAFGDHNRPDNTASRLEPELVSVPPQDFPPESFFLSREAELDWLNQNAFYERKDSQKGNSTANSTSLNPNQNPNSTSQRISLKPKASIIGLPKPQKTYLNESKNRRQHCKIAYIGLFPKRAGSRGKTDPPLSEPSSPKVSCIGRVRSKRDRSRCIHRQKSGRSDPSIDKPARVKKLGLFSSFRAIFRSGGRRDVTTRGTRAPPMESPPRKSMGMMTHDIRSRLPPDDVDAIYVAADSPQRKSAASRKSFESEPVVTGLGGMKRFASGRKGNLLADADVA